MRDHAKEELSTILSPATDTVSSVWLGRAVGIADRTDYDLKAHQSIQALTRAIRPGNRRHYIPYVVEPSLGADRRAAPGRLRRGDGEGATASAPPHPALAPSKPPCCRCPKLAAPATEIFNALSKEFAVDYDDAGSIGKRYRRQDEIGTPCITYDFDRKRRLSPCASRTAWPRAHKIEDAGIHCRKAEILKCPSSTFSKKKSRASAQWNISSAVWAARRNVKTPATAAAHDRSRVVKMDGFVLKAQI